MASALTQTSVATVVEDIVADRSIPIKVIMIILNIAHIITNWIVVIVFVGSKDQKFSALDLPISLTFLLVGCYLIPGITNGVIYYLRWKRSSVSNRRRIEEENKQAWACLRITLTLLGLPTVGRYIETITVSLKLDKLEKDHLHNSVAAQKESIQPSHLGGSGLGANSEISRAKYSNHGGVSVISGISHQSSINSIGMPENTFQKVRRARRHYKRCEHDGALTALVAGGAGGGPMAVVLLFLYFQRVEKLAVSNTFVSTIIVAFIFNIFWLSATLSHFYPARYVQTEAEFERGVRASRSILSLLLLFSSHLIQTTLRVIILAVFTNWFYAYVLIVVILHWVVGAVLFIGYRLYMRPKTVGAPFRERIGAQCSSLLSSWYFGFVGIFDFVNGNEGKTRFRYLIYYAFYYAENIIMLVIWLVWKPKTQIVFPIPFVCALLGLFWVGFLLLQLHLYYFSYSPYGSSIFGFCCHDKTDSDGRRRGSAARYAEEVRDPVFGVVVAKSATPLSNAGSRLSGGPGSRLSGTTDGNRSKMQPPSIISSRSPQSILSQQPDHKTLHNRPPPVLQIKNRGQLPSTPSTDRGHPQKLRFSNPRSDDNNSSSESDTLPVFSPKQLRSASSQPDLVQPSPSISSPSEPTEIKGKFKANYYGPVQAHMKRYSKIPSHSVENLNDKGNRLTPIVPPSTLRTKPIMNPVPSGAPAAKYRPSSTLDPYAKHTAPHSGKKSQHHSTIGGSKTHRIK